MVQSKVLNTLAGRDSNTVAQISKCQSVTARYCEVLTSLIEPVNNDCAAPKYVKQPLAPS